MFFFFRFIYIIFNSFSGNGWFSFKKLRYFTYEAPLGPGTACDPGPETYGRDAICDIKIQVYINDETEPRYETPMDYNRAKNEITKNFRSPEIRNTSIVRFDMIDGDNNFFTGDQLILRLVLKIENLIRQKPQKVVYCPVGRDGIHRNCLEIWRPSWQADYTTF